MKEKIEKKINEKIEKILAKKEINFEDMKMLEKRLEKIKEAEKDIEIKKLIESGALLSKPNKKGE